MESASREQTTYTEIRDQLRTGDLILYSGKQRISALIKALTFSRWSHVGMVVRLPTQDLIGVWESTKKGTGLEDLDSGTARKGVQFVVLSDRARTYKGRLAIRRLHDARLGDLDYQRLWKLRQDLREKPYETDRLELFKAVYDGPFGKNKEDLSSVFCSELVAEAYQTLGLLDEKKPSNEYVPADFSSSRRLDLTKGELGPEILLTEA